MSQRNPMNDRYKEEGKGKTRKSASSAKPKRKSTSPQYNQQLDQLSERERAEALRKQKKQKQQAESAIKQAEARRKKTPEEKAAEKEQRAKEAAERRENDPRLIEPNTPEFKRYRRLWWIFLLIATAATIASWFFGQKNQTIQIVGLVIAFATIGIALYIDMRKIKPMQRKAAQELAEAKKSGKARRRIDRKGAAPSGKGGNKETSSSTKDESLAKGSKGAKGATKSSAKDESSESVGDETDAEIPAPKSSRKPLRMKRGKKTDDN